MRYAANLYDELKVILGTIVLPLVLSTCMNDCKPSQGPRCETLRELEINPFYYTARFTYISKL
jgi:hypothetical protein